MLAADGLTTRYGSIAALRDATLHVDAGTTTAALATLHTLERLADDQLPGPAGRNWTARLGVTVAGVSRIFAHRTVSLIPRPCIKRVIPYRP